ncbi:MAG TPA: nodulation protein NfeD [Chondromyces sp.]|nr:nodulation protein NfeD [Chondromyces sp.]
MIRGKLYLLLILVVTAIGWLSLTPSYKAEEKADVFVIPVHNEVEKGLNQFLKRAIKEAEESQAELIVLDIHTPGGLVDAAAEIGKLLDGTKTRTVAFINDRALSAGAYIALHTDAIYMMPNAQMGAAAIIDQQGNMADQKAQSYWRSAMKSAAENHGVDPVYAIAMADPDVDLPKYNAGKGKLLTLSSKDALETGYSKMTVNNLNELLAAEGQNSPVIERVEESFSERVARFVTNPVVVPILLSIASLGLIIELYSPGFGLPGAAGLTSLLLFFYGHHVAGLAEYEAILLFVVGVGLIAAEFFLPGGIAGIAGLAAVVGSILMSGESVQLMGISLLIAIAVAIIGMILMVKVLGRKMKFFKKLILTDSTNTEKGYVSNVNRTELVGKMGVTQTPLRPSGTIVVESDRIDAVTEGGYIPANKQVVIVKVEGSRIVVREVES